MAVVGELLVLIGANNTALTAGLAKSEAELKGFSSSATSSMAGIRMAALGVGVAAVAGMGLAVNAAGDFQEQMAIINTIAHQTPAELAKTGEGIRAMAVSSGTSITDLTGAFYDLLSAGIRPGADALNMLGLANTLAIGGLATTKQTVDLLTTAVNAYGLNARGAAVATDQFALAVQDGKVTADQIASTFADIAPLAKTAGIGIDEISAAYAVLTARGVQAPEAMTQMNRAIVELIKPNKELVALQDKTHINFAKVASEKGLIVALEELRVAADANHVPFTSMFGRLEGMKFALATTGPFFKQYEAELTRMHGATGTAADQAAERADTFSRQTAILGTSINDLAITIGTGLLPPLTAFVEQVSGAIQGAQAWAAANPQIATAILPVTAAIAGLVVVATSLSVILGVVGTAVGILTSPILLAIAAIAVLAAHFGLLGDNAKAGFDGAIGAASGFIDGAIGAASGFIDGFIRTLTTNLPLIWAWIRAQAVSIAIRVLDWADGFIAWISPMVPLALAALGDFAEQVAGWIVAQAPGWVDQIGAWAAAFVDWVAPMIDSALGTLGDLSSQVIAWIGAQAPGWIAELEKWSDTFIAWIGPMVGKTVDALGALTAQIVGWLGNQIGPVSSAALPVGSAIVGAIAGALGKLPGLLGDAIGNATKNFDVSKVPGNLGAILGGSAIIAAVVAAGQLVGAAYSASMTAAAAVVTQVKGLLSAALGAEQAAISKAVGFVAGVVGAAFSAAFSGAATAVSGLATSFATAMVPVQASLMATMGTVGGAVGTALDVAIAAGVGIGAVLIAAAVADAVHNAISPDGGLQGRTDLGHQLPGDQLAWPLGPKNTPKLDIGPFQNVLGGDSGFATPTRIHGFAQGGIVPGSGAQLAIVHGGETITPAGQRNGQPIQLHHTTVLQVDGKTIGQIVEELLFNSGSAFSSGYAGSPVTE